MKSISPIQCLSQRSLINFNCLRSWPLTQFDCSYRSCRSRSQCRSDSSWRSHSSWRSGGSASFSSRWCSPRTRTWLNLASTICCGLTLIVTILWKKMSRRERGVVELVDGIGCLLDYSTAWRLSEVTSYDLMHTHPFHNSIEIYTQWAMSNNL